MGFKLRIRVEVVEDDTIKTNTGAEGQRMLAFEEPLDLTVRDLKLYARAQDSMGRECADLLRGLARSLRLYKKAGGR